MAIRDPRGDTALVQHADPRGSLWRRWDPHLHAPGTVLNDRFGDGALDAFLTRLENSTPTIRALGVTDYLSLDTYERVVAEKRRGRLPDADLLFANVELRFAVSAGKSSPVNFHLLVSPEDADHVERARRLLREFTFEFGAPGSHETYRCTRDDLIRLGRKFDPSVASDAAALEVGTNQFKVEPDTLLAAMRDNAWARDNVLLAVAASSNDGTAQLQKDASLSALRRKLEAAANVIFSGQEKQRAFWLGRGAVSIETLREVWGGPKPCLHGSDAHDLETTGAPALDRFTWIKGDVTFESLRQACIEPEGRTFVGTAPPIGGVPSQVITDLTMTNTAWLSTPSVPFNPGLVAVIGARGSGKTALVEFVATGAFSVSRHLSDRSFLRRAAPHLGKAQSAVSWRDGAETSNVLSAAEIEDMIDNPHVQYLSQQFVDQLCSSEGLADELIEEIQRVVFQAHAVEDRLGATNFTELLEKRAARARAARTRAQVNLAEATQRQIEEQARHDGLPGIKKLQAEKAASIERSKQDRKALLSAHSEERLQRLEVVTSAAERVRALVDARTREQQALTELKDEVEGIERDDSPRRLRELGVAFGDAKLSAAEWEEFRLVFKGDVRAVLKAKLEMVAAEVQRLRGPAQSERPLATDLAATEPYVDEDADLAAQTLSLLDKEQQRLQTLVGVDQANRRRYNQLNEKITIDEAALRKLFADRDLAEGAVERLTAAAADRRDAYRGVVLAIADEEVALEGLYAPLAENLIARQGTVARLSFSARRRVDLATWAAEGESLFDLRKAGPFRGGGALAKAAERVLLPAWTSGTADDVSKAMVDFVAEFNDGIRTHRPDMHDRAAVRAWVGKVGAWLYRTSHITLAYGVQYDGVDIEQLSPGTRGIVLLLLYLALDQDDTRPLIIDQPEENLDPKSIYEDLVGHFREARSRRQIIIVTHNANLVVNTDADQVIVAICGPHRRGQLPMLCYESGGLENAQIRRQVCDILEGGADAFHERARRLRLNISS